MCSILRQKNKFQLSYLHSCTFSIGCSCCSKDNWTLSVTIGRIDVVLRCGLIMTTRNVGQCDGRPAEYRWRPLFNAAKFGWRPLLQSVCAVTLPRRETRWNVQGCPKLPNRSQPLVGRSSPHYKDMWSRHCCLTSFFPIVDTCLSCEDTARQSCPMVPRWRFFDDFLRAVFSASRMQYISHLHSKCTQGHTMCRSMIDIQSATAEIRRGKKQERRRRNVHTKPG